jgi:hypothetical protein
MKRIVEFGLMLAAISLVFNAAQAQSGPYQYYPLPPCRVVDTRDPLGTNGGPALGMVARDFAIRGHCGVPFTAKAISANLTITNATTGSFLTVWPSGGAKPLAASLNFDPNSGALGNGIVIGLSANTNDLSVYNANGMVDVIIDVSGYFQ